MNKIHIDKATNTQIDYAVAVAQGWTITHRKASFPCGYFLNEDGHSMRIDKTLSLISPANYHPTINQSQCGELIDNFKINILFKNNLCECFIGYETPRYDKYRLVAACKAFLWSKYPDGMIPIKEIKK